MTSQFASLITKVYITHFYHVLQNFIRCIQLCGFLNSPGLIIDFHPYLSIEYLKNGNLINYRYNKNRKRTILEFVNDFLKTHDINVTNTKYSIYQDCIFLPIPTKNKTKNNFINNSEHPIKYVKLLTHDVNSYTMLSDPRYNFFGYFKFKYKE